MFPLLPRSCAVWKYACEYAAHGRYTCTSFRYRRSNALRFFRGRNLSSRLLLCRCLFFRPFFQLLLKCITSVKRKLAHASIAPLAVTCAIWTNDFVTVISIVHALYKLFVLRLCVRRPFRFLTLPLPWRGPPLFPTFYAVSSTEIRTFWYVLYFSGL